MRKLLSIIILILFMTSPVTVNASAIKWVDFNVNADVLKYASCADIETYGTGSHKEWITIISLMACKNGNDFSNSGKEDVSNVVENYDELLKTWQNKKIFKYYIEAFSAVLSGLLGEGVKETRNADGTVELTEYYGILATSPVAAGYYYSHYDDFGASRSYGYKRSHLGHDIMCSVGTPIVAVEAGYVECCGWNQYGGWRIGIRSFDSKRYYYYAHLKKGHPYCDIYEGKTVAAGEVIGYAGMTGYSAKEDTNNINVPHLHFGEELIFSPEQKDGYCQIWINMYEITKFLEGRRAETKYDEDKGEHFSKTLIYPKYSFD
ncbi:MAG: M23 family metallopeptidase [Clostridia bacterium]|nr:M23 family metallopeptidase [Clostridia bacterium]